MQIINTASVWWLYGEANDALARAPLFWNAVGLLL